MRNGFGSPRPAALLGAALLIGCIALAGACKKKPPLVDIEIVPGSVVVSPNALPTTTFVLEARLWTGSPAARQPIGESQGYLPLQWTSDQPWLTLASTTGFSAKLEVKAGTAPVSPAFVTVTAGGKTAPPAPISIAPATITGQDVVSATYDADRAPDVVVVNGIPSGAQPCAVTHSAFVNRSMLGNLIASCTGAGAGWDAAVLAVDHDLLFPPVRPPGWTPGQDPVDAGTLQRSPLTLPVALRIMVGNPLRSPAELVLLRDSVLKQAQADVAASNSLLTENRTGIQLSIAGTTAIPVTQEVSISDCLDGDDQTLVHDDAGLLNLYYVNKLAGQPRGRTCDRHDASPPHPTRLQDVIYISWNQHSPTTLIHELGHALGLTQPGKGHSDILAGFDVTNIMTSGESGADPVGRHRLTVGQVFRMNADPASWLNAAVDLAKKPVREPTAPRLACQCRAADLPGLCPPLVADVARPSGAPQTAQEWDCFDQLQIAKLKTEEDEEPVGILAGRGWRSPPGACGNNFRATTEKHWLATYVEVANLTRPGSCDSWAALFFLHHGVLYLKLAEPDFTWTQGADELTVPNDLPNVVDIAVDVAYPTGQKTDVEQEVKYASTVFGEENRAGIKLNFSLTQSSGSCSTTPPPPLTLDVCYTSGVGEGKATGRLIKITSGTRSTTTLAHFIGQGLGLEPLTPPASEFVHNIMRPLPADRGQKLTLGQVFRINVPLNPSWSISACDPGPAPCPPLAATVAP